MEGWQRNELETDQTFEFGGENGERWRVGMSLQEGRTQRGIELIGELKDIAYEMTTIM